jgi:Na+-translocating ferredoxin:NAD+ oxidoreductase RnfG subunit
MRLYFRDYPTPAHPMPSAPKKLRKQYVNSEHPVVVLRFEDGHEIIVKKGGGKTFDAYAGETIKVLAVYDKTSGERELVESRKADEFPDA